MRKLFRFLFVLLSIVTAKVGAQTGSSCSNPIVGTVCDSATYATNTNNYQFSNITWQVGGQSITTIGRAIYYQVNIPASNFYPIKIIADIRGSFPVCCQSDVAYFFWFDSSACSSNPFAVDSVYLSGTPTSIDSFSTGANVNIVQSTYYLVIAFKNINNYDYTVDFGYRNSQPFPKFPFCINALPPYKGAMSLDSSRCYTSLHPYQLPLSTLNDNPNDTNILLPSSLNQKLDSLPINDDNGNGFILTLKRTDNSNQEVYKSFDAFPYTYNTGGANNTDYNVAITVFFKNNGGATGLKGFKIRIPGASINNIATANPQGKGLYDTTGTWVASPGTNGNTCVWFFNGAGKRGDNTDNSGYSCKTYTFDVDVFNLGDTIQAWYMPDFYGNDSLKCDYGHRTDCAPADTIGQIWIPFAGSGAGGGMTGSSCEKDSSCYAGIHATECNQYFPSPYSQCSFANNTPSSTYDDNGCVEEIDPYWSDEGATMGFQNQNLENGGIVNAGICDGKPYELGMTGFNLSGSSPTYLAFNDVGTYRPVDSLGNINYNEDIYVILANGDTTGLPVYPTHKFTIPLTVPGTYSLVYTYYTFNPNNPTDDSTIQYFASNCGSGTLILKTGTTPTISVTASADTICIGANVTIQAKGNAYSYQWLPGNVALRNDSVAVASPSSSTTYTIIGTDKNGTCADTAYDTIIIHCLPQAYFSPNWGSDICVGICEIMGAVNTANITSWQWSFPGGIPGNFNGKQPPQICYDTVGTYYIKLVVTNAVGKDSLILPLVVEQCVENDAFKVSDTSLCKDDCITITPFVNNQISNLEWSFPGGNPSSFSGQNPPAVCYDTVGKYRIRLAEEYYGYPDTFYMPVYVHALPQPQITTHSGDTLVCSPSVNYQWYYNNTIINGATKQYYVAKQNGKYSVKTIVNQSCSGIDSTEVINTGLNGTVNDNDLIISPNPNDGKFQVASSRFQVVGIEVYNMFGERIEVSGIKYQVSGPVIIDLSSEPQGVYFVRVQTRDKTVMKKVVISR